MECGLAVVGENIISTLLGTLSDELALPMIQEFARKEQVHAHFKKWETILFKIQAVLQDAEERQFTDRSVKIWLDDLKDLAYDIEDVLDDFSTEALRQKSMPQTQSITGKIRKYVSSFLDHFSFTYRMASMIKEITARLEDIVKQKDDLGLIESIGSRRNGVLRRMPSTSLVNESLVFGRERDKEHIIHNLVFGEDDSSDGGISVIPIVGMGGLGKTTLAQLIYNDARVETFFKLRAWVCVSEEFDVVRVMKTLLEVLTSKACDVNDLNEMQVRVKKILSKQRFLIVLDDVWNENYNDWMFLRSPFEVGSPESRIILTTRNQPVASVMGTVPAYHLKEMSHDHCLSLFTEHALRSRNFDEYPNLKMIEQCNGQFLTKFKNLTSLTWLKIENISNLSCLPENFTCLVLLEVLEIEDCGGLTSLWLKGSRLENLSCLKRLAIMKCPQLLCLMDEENELPSNLEYVEIEDCSNLAKLPNGLQKLRSLKDLSVKWCPKLMSFPNAELPSTLKTLSILGCESLESLPKGLVHNGSSSIGRCNLDNLEILGCPSLRLFSTGELPTCLKQLDIWDCMQLKCIPERLLENSQSLEFIRIGNCKNLKTLPQCLYRFDYLTELHVNQCPSLESFPEKGLPIRNLNLVLISNCVNLKSLPNRMHYLTSLQYLTLFGCPSVESFPEGGFPPYLLSLSISGCKKLTNHFPKWPLHKLTCLKYLNVGDLHMISFPEEFTIPTTLVHLRVQSLPNLEYLSKGLQDLVFLESLDVWNCPKLQYLPKDGLPSMLGLLQIRNCPLLEKKCLYEKGEYWPIISHLPCVRINYVDIC
ncbi:Disease resistance protein [Corchorus olitorius]|uniref:Disease resistance protein n=1 Tax=Corchorus olitorius TaxID=93759 RepID=A0A1R3KNY4_9ROSI|nr:Disease resistance protein [Corchorus olitorius]